MKVLDLLALKGKTAVVTGGSRGLGLQMAEALGEMGARVAITARKKDELEAAVSHLQKLNVKAEPFVSDIGKREAIGPLGDELLFGKLASGGHVRVDVPEEAVIAAKPLEDGDESPLTFQFEAESRLPVPAIAAVTGKVPDPTLN